MKVWTHKFARLALATALVALPCALRAEDQPKPAKEGKEARDGEKKREQPPGVFGEIVTMDASSIQIKARKTGETVTLKLTDTTVYGDKENPKQSSDFKVGDVVAVGFDKAADGSLVAKRVMTPKRRPDGEGKKRKEGDAPAK